MHDSDTAPLAKGAQPNRTAPRTSSTWLLAIGPVTLTACFLIRAVRPVIDATLLGIGVVFVAATIGTVIGSRIAASVLVVLGAAMFQPMVARDLSFSLDAVDSDLWRLWAIVTIIALGWSLLTGAVVVIGRPRTTTTSVVAAAGGVGLGVALLGLFPLLSDQPADASDLSADEIAELPEVALVNYAYGLPDTEIPSTETYRAKLVNPSDLPHTFTIDALDVDVYVPAGRWAIVEFDPRPRAVGPVTVVCTIGDHETLGMTATLEVAS